LNTESIRATVRQSIERSGKRFLQDADAISDDKFAVSPGGTARSAADFTYECTILNHRFAGILRGETPAASKNDGWLTATGEATVKSTALAAFKVSSDDLLAAFDLLKDEELDKLVPGLGGPIPAYAFALFAGAHVNYHDGQLNYIQALNGDDEMHWK